MKIRNSLSRLGLKPWLLIVVLTMSGCASGPPFQKVDDIPAGKGLIYIYRPSVMHGAALVPYIVINDLSAIPLKVTIDVKAGETYYVRAGTIFMAFGVPYIESVAAEVGLPEISECKRLPDVPGV